MKPHRNRVAVRMRTGGPVAGVLLDLQTRIPVEKVQEELVRQALAMTGCNQTKAAKLLDISRDFLRYRMHKIGSDQPSSEP